MSYEYMGMGVVAPAAGSVAAPLISASLPVVSSEAQQEAARTAPPAQQEVRGGAVHLPQQSAWRPTSGYMLKLAVTGLVGWYAYKKTDGSIPWTAAAVAAGYFVIPPLAFAVGYTFSPTRAWPNSIEQAANRFEYAIRPQWLNENWRLRNF
jgi:hypothetical protein